MASTAQWDCYNIMKTKRGFRHMAYHIVHWPVPQDFVFPWPTNSQVLVIRRVCTWSWEQPCWSVSLIMYALCIILYSPLPGCGGTISMSLAFSTYSRMLLTLKQCRARTPSKSSFLLRKSWQPCPEKVMKWTWRPSIACPDLAHSAFGVDSFFFFK